jgi:hypothetical protein
MKSNILLSILAEVIEVFAVLAPQKLSVLLWAALNNKKSQLNVEKTEG